MTIISFSMKLKAIISFANARPTSAFLCTSLPAQESDIIICNLLSVLQCVTASKKLTYKKLQADFLKNCTQIIRN